MWGKLKFKVLRKLHIFRLFQTIFVQNIGKFSQKIFAIFGLKSLKLRRFFDIWKWTEVEDEDGSSDENLRSFVATLVWSRARYLASKLIFWCENRTLKSCSENFFPRKTLYIKPLKFLLNWIYLWFDSLWSN